MQLEAQLVRHIAQHEYGDLGADVLNAARRTVLWALGTALAGTTADESDRIVRVAREMGGTGPSTMLGFGDRLPAIVAGFANGCFAKALEYEDKFWMDEGHGYGAGVAVVPAVFATAEHLGNVDGKRLLTAVALATDVQARLYTGAPKAITSGWDVAYLFATFGAAAGAAKLMGLNEEQITNALGIAYSQLAGTRQAKIEGVLALRCQMGFGVRNGITAAMLARQGITGANNFLTGRHGLFSLLFSGDEVDLEAVTRDLGRHFQGTRLGFKAYPCGAVAHPVLDAVLSLLGKDGVSAETIKAVKVYGTPRMSIMVEPKQARQNPTTHIETEFSLPWAVACTIVDGGLKLEHFKEQALHDARYVELARTIDSEMDPNARGVWVEITLKDGRTVKSERVMAAKGHPDNPQTTDEMVEKYREFVQYAPKPLPLQRTEEAKDMILALDDVADVGEVMRRLSS